MQQSNDGAAYAELLAFLAVAEELSFARAGKRLGRDPTVLSRRVGALEARLGVRLLERTTRAVSLTEAGAVYFERAQSINLAMEEVDQEAGALARGEPRGHLRISVPDAFGRLWLAPVLVDFLRSYPLIRMEAEFSNRFVDLIGERFDLAVRIGQMGDSRLIARKLADRRRFICAAPDYIRRHGAPRVPGDLENHHCLIYAGAPGQRWEFQRLDGSRQHVYVTGPLIAGDLDVLVQAAIAGLGILLSSEWLLAPQLRTGRLVRVLPDWTVPDMGAIHIVTPSGTRHASKTRAFSDFLIEKFSAPPWTLR